VQLSLVALWHFYVVEEILQHTKTLERFNILLKMMVGYLRVGLNVCGCAGIAESNRGR